MKISSKSVLMFFLLLFNVILIVNAEDKLIDSLDSQFKEKRTEWISYQESHSMEIGEHIIFPVIHKIINFYMIDSHVLDQNSLIQTIINNKNTSHDTLLADLMISQLEKLLVLQKDQVSLNKKKEIIEFLLQYKAAAKTLTLGVSYFLSNFYDKQFYSETSRKVIKTHLLDNKIQVGDVYLLFDAAGMNNDEKVVKYIKKKSESCKIWGNRDPKWFCLLLMSRWGDKEALLNLSKIAKIQAPEQNRTYQAHYMPFELSIVQEPECVELLVFLMNSDSEYQITEFETANLAYNSFLALTCIFPDVIKKPLIGIDNFESKRKQYIETFSEKDLKISKVNMMNYPSYTKNRIWR